MSSREARRVAIVTGANSGIGLETARELARRDYRVIMTARHPERGHRAVDAVRASVTGADVSLELFDLADMSSVRASAQRLLAAEPRVDCLVNNAGLILQKRRTTVDGFEATFAINHLGPFLFTRLLLPRLIESGPARVVNVASRAHQRVRGMAWEDLMNERRRYVPFIAYGQSKLANILFSSELARRVRSTRVTSCALHPGVVATGFARDGDLSGILGFAWRAMSPLMLSAAEGARTTLYCATSVDLEGVTGKYYSDEHEVLPSAAARSEESARHLWLESERLLGRWLPIKKALHG